MQSAYNVTAPPITVQSQGRVSTKLTKVKVNTINSHTIINHTIKLNLVVKIAGQMRLSKIPIKDKTITITTVRARAELTLAALS